MEDMELHNFLQRNKSWRQSYSVAMVREKSDFLISERRDELATHGVILLPYCEQDGEAQARMLG